jgi:hypothetical protein
LGILQDFLRVFSGSALYLVEEAIRYASHGARQVEEIMCCTCFVVGSPWRVCRLVSSIATICLAAILVTACVNRPALLHELIDARRLASAMHVEFTKASEAANRAVMAATDEASAAAADEARRARGVVAQHLAALAPLVTALAFPEDVKHLDAIKARFDEYQKLDDEILALAVENSNVKAQRLAFGPSRQASEAFRTSVEAVVRSAGTEKCSAESLAARAAAAVLEIEVLQPPHIAESEDAAMTRMEEQMARSDAEARKALEQLKALLPGSAGAVAAAGAALDRFMTINAELVKLSRRNSNVRSLALTLGRKRVVAAQCDDQLRALEESLATHEFSATR